MIGIGDRVRLTLTRMSLTLQWLVIRGYTTTVGGDGTGSLHWRTTYQTEEIA